MESEQMPNTPVTVSIWLTPNTYNGKYNASLWDATRIEGHEYTGFPDLSRTDHVPALAKGNGVNHRIYTSAGREHFYGRFESRTEAEEFVKVVIGGA